MQDDTFHTARDSRRDPRDGWSRAGGRFRVWLRSRTADHWIMFVAGLLIGALVL